MQFIANTLKYTQLSSQSIVQTKKTPIDKLSLSTGFSFDNQIVKMIKNKSQQYSGSQSPALDIRKIQSQPPQ